MFYHSNRIVPFARPVMKFVWNLRPCGQISTSRNLWDLTRPNDFRNLVREMDRTMERFERDFFNNFPFRRTAPRFVPIQGVVQKEGETFRVNVDIDGFKPEEINIALKDHKVVIKGKMERKAEDGSKYCQEFTRELTIPENVDPANLKSYLSNDGLLSIEAPFNSEPKPKEIPVSRE